MVSSLLQLFFSVQVFITLVHKKVSSLPPILQQLQIKKKKTKPLHLFMCFSCIGKRVIVTHGCNRPKQNKYSWVLNSLDPLFSPLASRKTSPPFWRPLWWRICWFRSRTPTAQAQMCCQKPCWEEHPAPRSGKLRFQQSSSLLLVPS